MKEGKEGFADCNKVDVSDVTVVFVHASASGIDGRGNVNINSSVVVYDPDLSFARFMVWDPHPTFEAPSSANFHRPPIHGAYMPVLSSTLAIRSGGGSTLGVGGVYVRLGLDSGESMSPTRDVLRESRVGGGHACERRAANSMSFPTVGYMLGRSPIFEGHSTKGRSRMVLTKRW